MKMHFLTRKCCVPECGNVSTMGDGCFKTYFEFPSDKTLRNQWFSAILVKQEADLKDVKICDDHFGPEAKFQTQNSIKRLRLWSVPTLKLPKFVCRTCYKTCKTTNSEKQICKCDKVKNEKEEKIKKEKEEKNKNEKQEKNNRDKLNRDKEDRVKENKKRESRHKEKSTREREREGSTSSSRSSIKSTDKKNKDSSSSRSRRRSGSRTRNSWTTEEKEALFHCIETHGRFRKTASGQFNIEWQRVLPKYREMGYFGNEKEIRQVWHTLRHRAKEVREDEMFGNKLDRKICKFLYGKKLAPRLSLKRETSPESDREASTSKRSRRKESSEDQHEKERAKTRENNKAKYGTYEIVNEREKKVKKTEKNTYVEKKRQERKRETHDREKEIKENKRKRRRIIESTDSSESEAASNDVEEDRSSGFGEMESERDNSEVEERVRTMKYESSSGDEYMTKEDIEAIYDQENEERKPALQEKEKFGIWEIKPENIDIKPEEASSSEESEEENKDEIIDLSSDDECWGLEDLKKFGVSLDAMFMNKEEPRDSSSGSETDDSQKTVICPTYNNARSSAYLSEEDD